MSDALLEYESSVGSDTPTVGLQALAVETPADTQMEVEADAEENPTKEASQASTAPSHTEQQDHTFTWKSTFATLEKASLPPPRTLNSRPHRHRLPPFRQLL